VAPTRTARNDLAAQLTEAAFHCRKGRPPPLGERHDLVPLREVSKISYAGIGPKGALNTGDGHGIGAVPIPPSAGAGAITSHVIRPFASASVCNRSKICFQLLLRCQR
jgi:hypothetical protein